MSRGEERRLLDKLLVEASEGVIECRGCGDALEPDCEACGSCGWMNPLIAEGFI